MTTTVSKDILATHSHLVLFQWAALAAGETGDTAGFSAGFNDRSIQVAGTFGGTTVTVEGSNDGSNWATLNDVFGDPLSFTVAGLAQVLECTRYVRVKSTGGAGASIIASLFGTRPSGN